jgi:hypothetical protein
MLVNTSLKERIEFPIIQHEKVIEKTIPGQPVLDLRGVLGIVPLGGPFGTVPELLFEKKRLIPEIQRMLVQTNIVLQVE